MADVVPDFQSGQSSSIPVLSPKPIAGRFDLVSLCQGRALTLTLAWDLQQEEPARGGGEDALPQQAPVEQYGQQQLRLCWRKGPKVCEVPPPVYCLVLRS